jgi:hypothetical protein
MAGLISRKAGVIYSLTDCDFYAGDDALWEQETPHERVEQFGTKVMRHERPWTRHHWINAA